MTIHGERLPVNDQNWAVVGYSFAEARLTSFTWSPRFERNIGMALLPMALTALGSTVEVQTPFGVATATVVKMPFE